MFEIWFINRDDWGELKYYKRKGFCNKLGVAIKIAKRLGDKAYVKKYGDVKPIWINNESFNNKLKESNHVTTS